MKTLVAPALSFAMLCVAIACAPDGPIGSSREDLTAASTATYGNVPQPNDHFGTTASVTVPDSSCSSIGVDQFRTTVAWEEEEPLNSDVVTTPLWIANDCGFNPMSIGNGGFAQPLTSALTGVAPEWSAIYPGKDMVWTKEPTLLPISNSVPAQRLWIVMVGQVGQEVGESRSIALVLSTDGGQTWHDPHLITDLGNFSGGDPELDDLAATTSFREDKCDGTYECSPNAHCPTNANGCTNDVLVTWTWANQRFFSYVSYYMNADHHWSITPNPPNNPNLIQHIGQLAPFNQTPESAQLNMSIVAGEWSQPGAIWPFVVLEWPASSNLSIGHEPTVQVDCNNTPQMLATESWHVATSWFGGAPWTALADSHPTANFPVCVGSDANGHPFAFRNALRSSMTYDPGSHSIVDAVAIPNPSQNSPPGTVVVANAYQFNTPPNGVITNLVFESSHSASGPEDQFLPVIKGQEINAPQTGLVIAYIDSIEDPLNQNRPFGFYGANIDQFNPNDPNVVLPCNSPSLVTNCWWFSSNYGRIWPTPPDAATLIGSADDDLGRHNSLSTASGEFFFTYGGAFITPNFLAQTTSLWPQ